MSCRDAEALWVARADGTLTADDEERLRAHSASCASCAGVERGLTLLEYALDGFADEAPEPPPYLKTRILARLDEASTPRRWALGRFLTSRRLLAVSTACLAFFAGLLVREIHRVNEWALGSGSREVVLQYQSPTAGLVTLAGDFNGWGRDGRSVRVEREGDRWLFRVRVEPGRYQYAFVVDGKKWLPDPQAPGIIPDGFGGVNSLLYVPGPDAARL
ncbi:MAG: zf-HC2 domain-containing protein [Deltaproteobacteria bacterium]|nr:zf-HC2 domain-containing protein [Deltaproteobacteria bacterium]